MRVNSNSSSCWCAVCDKEGCNKKIVLEAGCDFKDDEWVFCNRCNRHVIQEEVINDK